MATEHPEGEGRSRRIGLRKRGGFSNSGISDSTQTEGGAGHALNDQVMDQAAQPVTPVPTFRPPQNRSADPHSDAGTALQDTVNAEEFTPQNRLEQVRRRASEYEREYRMGLLHRLLMRNIPLDEIANQLQISVSQVIRDRQELFSRLRQAAKDLNIDEMVGHNKGMYEEVVGMALRAASNASAPLPMRLAAMRTALAGQNDMHRFFQAAGVYDVLRFRRAPGGDGANDIQRMLALTEELLADTKRAERQETTPNPLGEFSGTDSENLDL